MALASLIVRIGADTSDLDKGIAKANRHVEQFGKKLKPMGRSLERIGHSASMAAGSLSRLGSVMPGVAGGAAKVVGSIGAAGTVIAETTILSVGLTKAWRLLTAASTAVAASSAPAWLASLATPAGLAVAGIVALTGAVVGLTAAWGKLKQRTARDPIIEEIDLTGRRMPLSAMTGQRHHTLETITSGTGQGLSDGNVELTLARQAVEAWGDALAGIRPITSALAKQWDLAHKSITGALADTSRFTEQATGDLYRMLAALRQVSSAQAPGGAGAINVGGLPGPKMFGHGLDARQQLGSKMDFRPKAPSLLDRAKSSASAFGGDAVQSLVQAFQPLAVVMPVISGIFAALAPILEPLVPIFESLGMIIGTVLAPVVKVVATALSFLAEGLGWAIRAIGRLVDALPGVSAKRVINAGQAMIDAARAARRNADATENATNKVNEFAGALSNIPRVLNVEALRHLVGKGSSKHGGGPTGITPPGTGGVKPMFSSASIDITIYGATDPRETAEAVGRELEWRLSRGGTNRLRAAMT